MKAINLHSKNVNADWAKKHTKSQFVKQHKHLDAEDNLKAIWDELNKK